MWRITRKLDGVQAVVHDDGTITSRSGKPLYNLPALSPGRYEVFLGTWNASVSAVRTRHGAPIRPEDCYQLFPPEKLDPRLILAEYAEQPSQHDIAAYFAQVRDEGGEGLVIHTPHGKWVKVKDKETHDLTITGYKEGRNRLTGTLGALLTAQGNVGTGFTRAHRDVLWAARDTLVGRIVEVDATEYTSKGKLRHPRFIRLREDKDKE